MNTTQQIIMFEGNLESPLELEMVNLLQMTNEVLMKVKRQLKENPQ